MNDSITATMSGSVIHSTFSIERTYPQPPARVFFAHVDQAIKRRWLVEGEGWEVFDFGVDFRVGGAETSRLRFQGGPEVSLRHAVSGHRPRPAHRALLSHDRRGRAALGVARHGGAGAVGRAASG